MVYGLLYFGRRCDSKSALTSDLIGRSNRGAYTISHHRFDLRIEGGPPCAQAVTGGRISQAVVVLDYVYGVAPHGYEQDGRIAKDYDP
jgi:hypothetical protein